MRTADARAEGLCPRGQGRPARPAGPAGLLMCLLVAAVLCADGPAKTPGAPGEAPAPDRTLSNYTIVWERNVFLSTRRKAMPMLPPSSRPAPPPQDPRQNWVLRGMLAQGDGYAAILENAVTGQTAVLQPGQTFLGEHVAGIVLDGLWLQAGGGGPRQVEIGRTLTGALAAYIPPTPPPTPAPTPARPPSPPPGEAVSAAAATTAPAGAQAGPREQPTAQAPSSAPALNTPGSIDEQTLLERLRQRRMQETGGRL